MRIQGLQKLTLLDYPERMACTVFTAGCNFRCPFCHNASLVTHIPEKADMDEERFFAFLAFLIICGSIYNLSVPKTKST